MGFEHAVEYTLENDGRLPKSRDRVERSVDSVSYGIPSSIQESLVSETIVVCLQKVSQNARSESQNPSRLLIPDMYSHEGIWDHARARERPLRTRN
jgi:hypothetical protein